MMFHTAQLEKQLSVINEGFEKIGLLMWQIFLNGTFFKGREQRKGRGVTNQMGKNSLIGYRQISQHGDPIMLENNRFGNQRINVTSDVLSQNTWSSKFYRQRAKKVCLDLTLIPYCSSTLCLRTQQAYITDSQVRWYFLCGMACNSLFKHMC